MGMTYNNLTNGDTYRFRYRTDNGEQGIVEFKSKHHYAHKVWVRAWCEVKSVGDVIMLEVIDWGV